ncbi:hypothetical protein DICPUDRAFT_151949 [Dictyostelium purpureum]|uniref:Peptidase C19 ubiquitin carboxyl-terminal hydrolase domain-containing protein n=1 Tax=Dictyostelium purpureum TaxID=5786 RepID=F0ZK44_DICPU|nr:uncharacterized protein DICPUDRAFT_151949 [Dictyostelium purpureum]EGC35686.1 hypothetical protein DICPUDRAFT_151949 [Dictyostelium purpureum]|eukprot:XP_003287786.1 hypothetical protein DICPUDRAFT_151949 [Dictyostelium purpureum]
MAAMLAFHVCSKYPYNLDGDQKTLLENTNDFLNSESSRIFSPMIDIFDKITSSQILHATGIISKTLTRDSGDVLDIPNRVLVYHLGNSIQSGHYICVSKDEDNIWLEHNDSIVSLLKNPILKSKNVYLCVYEKSPYQDIEEEPLKDIDLYNIGIDINSPITLSYQHKYYELLQLINKL